MQEVASSEKNQAACSVFGRTRLRLDMVTECVVLARERAL